MASLLVRRAAPALLSSSAPGRQVRLDADLLRSALDATLAHCFDLAALALEGARSKQSAAATSATDQGGSPWKEAR